MRYFLLILLLIFCPFKSAISNQQSAIQKTHAVATYGDIKYPSDFKHFEYVNPDAPKGGTLTMPWIGTFNNLNPFILKGKSANGTNLLFDTLMTSSLDETATNYPLIAESAEVPKSNKYIIFNLNPAAKFSDGSPLTADDVVFSFETLKEKGHPQFGLYYKEITKAEKLSPTRVKFHFANPANRELKYIVGQFSIFSKKYYEENDFEKTTLQPPLGSGPYIVDSVDQGRQITYKLNPDYWAKDLPVNKGFYNFDKIKIEYYSDINVAIEAFKAGKLDMRYENVAKNWARGYNIPQVEDGRIKKEKIDHMIPTGMQGFAFNTRRTKFQDRNIRKALNLAMDFEWMNDNLFYSQYTRTDSYFENSIYASSGLPQGKELALLERFRDQLPSEVFEKEFTLPKSDGSGRIRNQLLEARTLLEKSGWKIKDQKLTNEKGEIFKVEFLTTSGSRMERVIAPIARNMEMLGIEAKIKAVDSAQYKKLTDDFDFDIMVGLWGQSNSPGNEQLYYWHSSSAESKGSQNVIGIKNPVVDSLVEEIINAKTKNDLIAATRALDRVMLWEYYVIPHFHAGFFRILYWNKFARPEIMPKFDSNYGLYTWWVK